MTDRAGCIELMLGSQSGVLCRSPGCATRYGFAAPYIPPR